MNKAQLEDSWKVASKITQRPQHTWSLKEESSVYWWYLHSDLECPTEEWLRNNVLRYRICEKHHIRWGAFLLQMFPSDENVIFIKESFGVFPQSGKVKFVMRRLLQESAITQNHIDLVLKYGGKNAKKKARRLLMKIWCPEI